MDNSIVNIKVLMEKRDAEIYPKYDLPKGYSFCNYSLGDEDSWSELQFSVNHVKSIEEGKEIFKDVFLSKIEDLKNKMVFVKDSNGEIVGTAALWDGNHFGETYQRVHWVAVSKNNGGRGIAKALVTKVLDIYNELGYKNYIYLASQTRSYDALNIYLKFGFKPYMEEKPGNWDDESFEKNNNKAWKIINDKLK